MLSIQKKKILLSINIIKSLSKLDNFYQHENKKDTGGIHITKFQLEQLYDSNTDIEKNTKNAITNLETFYITQKKDNSEESNCKYCDKKYTSRGIKLYMNKCHMNGM